MLGMTFWYGRSRCGSGSSDPYLRLTDPGGPKTYGSYGSGCGFGTLVHLHHSSKIISHKEVRIITIKLFLEIFSWWWKDPEPDPYLWLTDLDADLGGPKTYGSCGSGWGCGSGCGYGSGCGCVSGSPKLEKRKNLDFGFFINKIKIW